MPTTWSGTAENTPTWSSQVEPGGGYEYDKAGYTFNEAGATYNGGAPGAATTWDNIAKS